MNFFFRTNFNQQIGIGHLVRSLRIYDKLRLKNNCKIFVDKFDPLIKKLAPEKFFEEIYTNGKFKNQKLDAIKFFNKIKKFKKGYIIIDDYRLDYEWEKILSKKKFKIISLDDLEYRKHYSDILINYDSQYLEGKNYNYELNKKSNAKYLLGPKYCILPNISNKNIKNLNKKKFSLTMYIGGGGDLKVLYFLIIKLLKKNKKNFYINIIIGPLSKNKSKIFDLSKKFKNINPIYGSTNLLDTYKKTDLFIGSASTSVYETGALNVPSILISFTKNQNTDILYLEKIGHYFYLDRSCIKNLNKIVDLIIYFKNNYKRIKKLINNPLVQIDDKGVNRILSQISNKQKKIKEINKIKKNFDENKLSIREVNDNDINHYLKARNLDININHSLNKKKILPLDHYNWWFNTNRKSYLLTKGDKKILYFYEEKIFSINKKEYLLSGWFACSKNCTIKDILYTLRWQRNLKKNANWLSFIKKNNKLSIYLSKFLGWNIMNRNNLSLKKLKSRFKIDSKKFFIYERNE